MSDGLTQGLPPKCPTLPGSQIFNLWPSQCPAISKASGKGEFAIVSSNMPHFQGQLRMLVIDPPTPVGFMWVWVNIKPPGYGPQVLVHVSIQGTPFWGFLFLTDSP